FNGARFRAYVSEQSRYCVRVESAHSVLVELIASTSSSERWGDFSGTDGITTIVPEDHSDCLVSIRGIHHSERRNVTIALELRSRPTGFRAGDIDRIDSDLPTDVAAHQKV